MSVNVSAQNDQLRTLINKNETLLDHGTNTNLEIYRKRIKLNEYEDPLLAYIQDKIIYIYIKS